MAVSGAGCFCISQSLQDLSGLELRHTHLQYSLEMVSSMRRTSEACDHQSKLVPLVFHGMVMRRAQRRICYRRLGPQVDVRCIYDWQVLIPWISHHQKMV